MAHDLEYARPLKAEIAGFLGGGGACSQNPILSLPGVADPILPDAPPADLHCGLGDPSLE
jgi:hypothetical protein